MAPLDKTVFIDPLDPSAFIAPPGGTSPGFTQDLQDILGNAGDPTDGFDELLAGLGQLVNLWDAASAAQDTELDAVLTELAAADHTSADNAMTDFSNSFAAGSAIVAGAQALGVPDMGTLETLWLSPNTTRVPVPTTPGGQVPGHITKGDPPFTWDWKFTFFNVGNGGVRGVSLLQSTSEITGTRLVSKSALYKVPAPVPPTMWNAQDLVVGIDFNPDAVGVFSSFIVLDADYPQLGNKVPRGFTVNVEAKPAKP